MRIRTAFAAIVLSLAIAACGGDDTSEGERPDIEDSTTPTEVVIEPAVQPTPTATIPDVEIGRLTYAVASGDTLGSIAADFGVPLGALLSVNDFEDPNLIGVGVEVIIPTEEEVADWEAAQAAATPAPAETEEEPDSADG
jgi:LysM repeat protein